MTIWVLLLLVLASEAEACHPGQRQIGTTCTDCAPGKYGTPSFACLSCPAGRYSPVAASTVCLSCGAGRFADAPESSSCELCEPGRFAALPVSANCSACEPGTENPLHGNVACAACRPGFAAPSEATPSCAECPVGRFSAQDARACLPCSYPLSPNATMRERVCPPEACAPAAPRETGECRREVLATDPIAAAVFLALSLAAVAAWFVATKH